MIQACQVIESTNKLILKIFTKHFKKYVFVLFQISQNATEIVEKLKQNFPLDKPVQKVDT